MAKFLDLLVLGSVARNPLKHCIENRRRKSGTSVGLLVETDAGKQGRGVGGAHKERANKQKQETKETKMGRQRGEQEHTERITTAQGTLGKSISQEKSPATGAQRPKETLEEGVLVLRIDPTAGLLPFLATVCR